MWGRGVPCPSESGVAAPRIIIDPGKGFSESLHCAIFAGRLRVLLALLALCKAITPAPTLQGVERGTHAIISVKGVWVRDLGSITWGERDREAANAGVASAPGNRQRFGGSTAQPGGSGGAARTHC